MVKQALKSAGGITKIGWVGKPTGQENISTKQLSWLQLSQDLGSKGITLCLLPPMGPF